MTGIGKDWIVVIVFFICFFAFTIAETAWIMRQTKAEFPKSVFVSFGSNIFAVTVGYFISFIIVGVLFALVWDQSIDQIPQKDAFMWTMLAAAALVPILLLFLIKRLLIVVSKLAGMSRPWLYSLAASLLFNFTVAGVPVLVAYFL